jgi:hypothetical protein
MSANSEAIARRPTALRGRITALASEFRLDGTIVASFVVSRLLVVAAAIAAEFLVVRNPLLIPADGSPVLTSLTSWDAWYYLGIVREGYHADPVAGLYRDTAFLPLYPIVVRILSLPWPQYAGLVAVIVSNVAFLLALGLLARLGEPYLGRRRAALAASFLAIYPFASAFAMAYTESLFLLTMVGAFLAAERGHRPTSGILFALACLCRFQGVALLLPLLIIMLRQDGWRPKPSVAWLVLGPIALAGFMFYVNWLAGSASAFLDAQKAWGREGIGGAAPDQTIGSMFTPYQGALVATLCWSIFMLVWARVDRLRIEYVLVILLFIAAELASGSLEAVGRVTMLAFPYVWILANRRSLFARRVWPPLSAGLFTLIALLSFAGYWVP